MFKPITIIVIVFACLYIAYILFEHFYYNYLRKKIKKVIHVNGIRGKSTVTRLIDAGLREFDFKVVSKTTGTVPTFIDCNNKERIIKRLGPANIREQLKMIRWAVKEKADYLVIECMAVNPELQNISEHKILKSDITVITNVRSDHLDVMGSSLDDIAKSLANTVPVNGTLVLGEDNQKDIFESVARKCNSKVIIAKEYKGEELLDTFRENIAVSLEVCDVLGLDKDEFFRGMRKYIHDVGALNLFERDGKKLINGFSINDPDSILKVYDLVEEKYSINKKDISILLNERGDRFFRTNQHIDMLDSIKYKNVYICGDNLDYIEKRLKEKNIDCKKIKSVEDIKDEDIIFGCGNIKGLGFKIIEYYKKGER